ncbi:hypothetical protein J3L18_15050 [Mucilaginibacter gossypii]|uniref:hypothetical protein n=1 Tax=Mucilaginibacter gossypii TaxID=551996 RepID=UPI000DCCF617|nr:MULTISPECIES: hypothetical protein [Mucilaginibacter]QTE40308.1 hypothetical protein J3L18_15050 [Mucilaginibacter gossypii]RAV57590.1 hypothetical protein DIU36_11345 [Mucilaginibacter rubeus]
MLPGFIKQVEKPFYQYRYSVCTLITRKQEYMEMLDTFIKNGFSENICEYLIIDNTETNKMDAYQGINSFLQTAKGEYIIICHQDILLIENESNIQNLDKRIAEMDVLDPNWAILGNAGAAARLYDRLAIKIAYPNGFIDLKGNLPQQVCSIDENFMLVKSSANLSLSSNIGGYHLYGLDICTVASVLGYKAYVIDFLLIHKSMGNIADGTFDKALITTQKKYVAFMKGRYVNTTIAKFYVSGSKIRNILLNTRVFRRIIKTAEEIKTHLQRG